MELNNLNNNEPNLNNNGDDFMKEVFIHLLCSELEKQIHWHLGDPKPNKCAVGMKLKAYQGGIVSEFFHAPFCSCPDCPDTIAKSRHILFLEFLDTTALYVNAHTREHFSFCQCDLKCQEERRSLRETIATTKNELGEILRHSHVTTHDLRIFNIAVESNSNPGLKALFDDNVEKAVNQIRMQ